jgi:hypothetical protein
MSQCRTDAARRLARGRGGLAFTFALLAFSALTGCSTAQLDAIPKDFGGLPDNAPRRSDNPPAYPAVHDVPPARSKELLDQDQQKRLEADLAAARARLQNQQKSKAKDLAKDLAKNQAKDGGKQPTPERDAAQSNRPTVKRGQRPTALSEDSPAPAKPQAGASGPAWPAPPGPDATGFGRNP